MSVETRFGNGAIKRNSILKTVGIAVFAALFCVGCGDKDEDTFTIIFDSNGGTVTPGSGTVSDGGTLISLPTPERDGYTFTGWYLFSTGSENQVKIDKRYYSDQTIYAHWAPITYAINYGLDGGSTGISTVVTSYTIETATFTLFRPNKSGYIFLGWTGTNGTTPQAIVTIVKGSTGDRDYNANWEPEP